MRAEADRRARKKKLIGWAVALAVTCLIVLGVALIPGNMPLSERIYILFMGAVIAIPVIGGACGLLLRLFDGLPRMP